MVLAVCGLALGCVLRFTTRLNDALSGQPAYMRALAHEVIRNLEEKGYDSVPLFAMRDEAEQCRALALTADFNHDALAFVVSYSETRHSFCLITYAGRATAEQDRVASVLPPSASESFGAELDKPVKGVPVAYFLKQFPDALIRLIDWHYPWPRRDGVMEAGTRNEGKSAAPAAMQSGEEFSFNLFRVRDEVARRHNRINLVLDCGMVLLILVAVVWGGFLRHSYLALRQLRLACGLPLSLPLFLRSNVTLLAREAVEQQRRIEEEHQAEERAAQLRLRRREEAMGRLKFLLETTAEQDEQTRGQIQACLDQGKEEDGMERMEQLAERLLAARGQRTPQDRLKELLLKLRELCSENEYDDYSRKAMLQLEREGFRAAREMLVHAHAELRESARKAAEEAGPPADGDMGETRGKAGRA